MQTFIEQYSAAFAGEIRVPMSAVQTDGDGRTQDHRTPRGDGTLGQRRG